MDQFGGSEAAQSTLVRDRLFVALTRPQLFAGVTYTFFVVNFILSTEVFLIARGIWVIAIALIVHAAGMLASVSEPRIFDIWLIKARHCPRVKTYKVWRCNSFRA